MKTFLKILFVRMRFVFVFVAIGLLVGNWSFLMNLLDKFTRPPKADSLVHGDKEWYCPMDPSVIRNEPGNCPICGMTLSERKRGEKQQLPPGVLSRLQLSPYRIRQAGLATEEIQYRTLVREVRTVGIIDFDERRLAHIAARTAGRVDRLAVDFTGTAIKKGDTLASIYSPDLVTTQEEYLLALKSLEGLEGPALARAHRLVESTRERLRLWGISDEQIKKLEETRKAEPHIEILSPIGGTVIAKHVAAGQYVTEGTELYEIADLSNVWAQAEVYERDIGLIALDQPVDISTEAYPGQTFPGAVSFVQPTLQSDTRTVKVRVDVPNKDGKLKPGMYVIADLRVPLGRTGEVFYKC